MLDTVFQEPFVSYYKSLLVRPGSFKNTLVFVSKTRKPIVLYALILFPLIGIFVELCFEDLEWATSNLHHLSMFAPFELVFVLILLRIQNWKIPEGTEYLIFAISFASLGILFYFHLERSEFDVSIHTHLCYIIIGVVVSTLFELAHLKSILAALTRCFFIIANGAYFFVAAELLHPVFPNDPESFDDHSEEMIKLVPVYFAWTMIFSLVVLFRVGSFQFRKFQKLRTDKSYHLFTDSAYACNERVSLLCK
ncbi:unnamed protein product [Allacma fusca]|uniref:Transmembrane protein n=1 Tax=Allacma fusca TaxID=39272 RepID=A0A8J2LUS9_9HEXA|nr:unnamed protein product [Allacma fusca]